MRDREGIYAAVETSEVPAQWRYNALVAVMAVTSTLLFWPGHHDLLAICLLVPALAVGCIWAWFVPPYRREKWWAPKAVILPLLSALAGLVIAVLTGPFVFALAFVGFTGYLVTFTINVTRYHRTHQLTAH